MDGAVWGGQRLKVILGGRKPGGNRVSSRAVVGVTIIQCAKAGQPGGEHGTLWRVSDVVGDAGGRTWRCDRSGRD
jgi:hypothetical protein